MKVDVKFGNSWGDAKHTWDELKPEAAVKMTAAETIAKALGMLTETVIVDDLTAAVRDAHEHARSGDVVLLSPACSSFDMFRNYAERGRLFKTLVQAL